LRWGASSQTSKNKRQAIRASKKNVGETANKGGRRRCGHGLRLSGESTRGDNRDARSESTLDQVVL